MKLLEKVRVLDLTNVLSGPFATMHLALLGAEVIKIENPDGGDLARKLGNVAQAQQAADGDQLPGPERQQEIADPQPEGRGGQGDLPQAARDGRRAWWRISGPGSWPSSASPMKRSAQINPKIVYCAISGFGQTGPDAFKPAYDQIIQGLSGVMAVNGDERLNPLRAGFPVCDTVGGLNAAFAIMAALYHRERTGEGQFIDIALLDSIMPLMGWVAANLLIGDQQPVLMGNDNFTAAPSGTFRTKDGYVNIAANQQKQWEDLADALGVPELKTDPRFQERDTRKANRKLLTPLLEEKLTAAAHRPLGGRAEREGHPLRRHLRPGGGAAPAAERAPPGDRHDQRAGHRRHQALQPDGQVLQDAGADRRAAAAAVGPHRRDPEGAGLQG